MSLSITFYQPETKHFRSCDRNLSPPTDSEPLWLPELLESESYSVLSDSLWPHGLYSPWNSPGRNTGVGSCSLLQGIIPNQGWNPGLLHSRWILYQLSHQGSWRIMEWVAYPFSRESSWPRNWTRVSCMAGRFWAPYFNEFCPLALPPCSLLVTIVHRAEGLVQ